MFSSKNKFIVGGLIFFCLEMPAALPVEEPAVKTITLSDGIDLILSDSRLIKIAMADKDMAFEDVMTARAAFLPQVNASLKQTFLQRQPIAKFGETQAPAGQKSFLSAGVDVYQTLYDFGKTVSLYNAVKDVVRARQANLDSVRRTAVLEFILAYFDLLEAQKMVTVAQTEVKSLTLYCEDVLTMFNAGIAVKNDLLPVQVRLADAKQQLIRARSNRMSATLKLNVLLALPLSEKVAVQEAGSSVIAVPEKDQAWNDAQENRPELLFIGSQFQASRSVEKAKKAANLPELYADGGYSYTENKYTVFPGSTYAVLGIKVNLFDGMANKALAEKERDRQKSLSVQWDKLSDDIHFELENSFLCLRDAMAKLSVAKKALAQAAENVRVTRVRYSEGIVNSTDVLESVTLQTKAQTNYYGAEYDVRRGYARLIYSMGGELRNIYPVRESK